MTPLTITGSTALLCGATGGLGQALYAELDRRGAKVTTVARAAERNQLGPGHHLSADLSDPLACDRAVATAIDPGGALDILINAVGVVAFGPVEEMTADEIRLVVETNVVIPMFLARAAAPAMTRGGVIVNLSGIIAEPGQAPRGMAVYAASKAATRTFDEVLARDLRRSGVRVLDARPPHTDTGLIDRRVAGNAPTFPPGLEPAHVAEIICEAIADGRRDLPSEAFANPSKPDES